MATYNSPSITLHYPTPVHGQGRNVQSARQIVTGTAAFAVNDTGAFFLLPPGAVVTGGYLKAATQLDSNGSPTMTVNIGTGAVAGVAAVPAQFWAASTVGRTAGASVDTTMLAIGRGYVNTTGLYIPVTFTIAAGPATGVAGTLELHMSYVVEDFSTTG